jgi:hypothetical protein
MTDSEYHQANLELQQMLEDALNRAEAGKATADDWNLIRYGCGLKKRPAAIFKPYKGADDGSYSESGF